MPTAQSKPLHYDPEAWKVVAAATIYGHIQADTREGLFCEMVRLGVFRVDPDGPIWRLAWPKYPGREPRRCEQVTVCGYLSVHAVHNVPVMSHRAVWTLLRGPIPDGMQINHINGNKQDNRLENLELCTAAENAQHSRRILGRGRFKLSDEDAARVRERYALGDISQRDLAAAWGMSQGAMCRVLRGLTHAGIADTVPYREAGQKRLSRPKDECGEGHALSDGNVYITPGGKRHCLVCKRAAQRRYKARLRALSSASPSPEPERMD